MHLTVLHTLNNLVDYSVIHSAHYQQQGNDYTNQHSYPARDKTSLNTVLHAQTAQAVLSTAIGTVLTC
jgi:hypothetical protein